MSPLQASILGILQGLSEFLPISSSGHLKLAESLFGFQELDRYLFFDIICHVGTLLAILLAYAAQLRKVDRHYVRDIIIATLPLIPCTLLLKPLKSIMSTPELLGYFFLGTATILLLGHHFAKQRSTQELAAHRGKHAFMVGIAQTLALFPGVSRSGTTISALRVMGWEESAAKQFAFLMAVPAILGSVVIETASLLTQSASTTALVGLDAYLIGFVTSFLSGYGILLAFFKVISLSSFRYFAYYCIAVGLFSLFTL